MPYERLKLADNHGVKIKYFEILALVFLKLV